MLRLSTKHLVILAVGLGAVAGCSESPEVSAKEDKQLRNGFGRTMSEEEVAKLRSGSNAAPPPGDVR